MRVLAVVPALNEATSLAPLLRELFAMASAQAWVLEVVVVDDASTDGTSEVARAGGARVVTLCRNLGIGAAVQTGLHLAARENFDAAVQIDGDGQHPPSELPKLIEAGFGAKPPDIVVGSRYLESRGFQSTRLRRLGIFWLRLLLRLLTGRRASDPTSGFRLYGPKAIAFFTDSYPHDYPEPEALVLASVAGLRVAEVPVLMKPRQSGASSISSLHAPYYMLKVSVAVVLAFCRRRKITVIR